MITKINKSIISVTIKILFIFLIVFIITVFTLLVWAKQGIALDTLTIFDHKFSKLYIKWNKKLHINILSITNLSKNDSEITVPPLYRILKTLDHTTKEIHIAHYIKGANDFSIVYKKHQLDINSSILTASATLKFLKPHIFIPNLKLDLKALKLKLDGEVRISEKNNKIEILSHVQVDTRLEADFFAEITKNRIELSANSESIPDLGFLKRFIKIKKNVQPWIFDKLQAHSYQLNNLSTHFPPSQPKKALSNLKAKVIVKDVSYTFEKALSPIISKVATIEYKNNQVNIFPTKATYAGYKVSQVKVTLSQMQKEPKLLLFFHTKEHVNAAFLKIIKHYLQKIPLEQFSGKNDIDFTLGINLKTSAVDIQSDIKVKDANLSINSKPVHIYNAKVHLDNNRLIIEHAKFQSFKSLKSSLSGNLNLKTLLGDLKISIAKFSTPMVKLLNDVNIHLTFKKDGLHIYNSNTHWQLFKHLNFMASKHTLFLDKNKTLHVNNMKLYKPGYMNANIQGRLDLAGISSQKNTLALNIKKMRAIRDNNETIVLEHPFSIKADDINASLFKASRSIDFSVGQQPVSLEALSLNVSNILKLNIKDFRYKDDFQAGFNLNYNQETQLGFIDINQVNSHLSIGKLELLNLHNKDFHFEINATKHIKIKENDLNISYSNEKKVHQFSLNSIAKIAYFSPLLQKHKIKAGRFNLISHDFNYFTFFTTINYFPIDGYINTNTNDTIFISSTYGKDGFKTKINDAISVSIDDKIRLDIENTNLDLQPFLKGSDTKDSTQTKQKLPAIEIHAKQGFLQLTKKGKILYSKLLASIEDNVIKATLQHKKGEALMILKENKLELYGEKFNDTFLQNLINFKGLEGGSYNFFMNGNAQKLQGGIEINNATAKGFALYNNILSFLNTIPALVSFQSPGFNSEGFKVNHGEIHFDKRNEIVNLKSIKLKGNASNIIGSGSVNVKKSTIDLTLRIFLLKEMGKILSSVPIAGYLLLGEDGSLTTTLTIKGTLQDPEISVNLGQDILMAPINILKRTLLAPVRLFDWIMGNDDKDKDEPKF